MNVHERLVRAIDAARSAPSAHNVQPWTFEIQTNSVVLGWNRDRELEHGDPEGRYLLTGLGAAAEAFKLGAAVAGDSVTIEFKWRPQEASASLLTLGDEPPKRVDVDLGRTIPYRQTSRWAYTRQEITDTGIAELSREAERVGCRLFVVTQRRLIRRAARLTGRGTALNFADPNVFSEFANLLRMSRRDPAYQRDGLTLETLTSNRAQETLRRIVLRPRVMRLMRHVRLHHLVAWTQRRLMLRSSAIALLVCPSHEPDDLFAGGRAMFRVWMRATQIGLRVHPMTAAMDHGPTRQSLAAIFNAGQDPSLIVCFRLGYGSAAPHSPRLPQAELLVGAAE